MKKTKKYKVPLEIIAARIANREMERILLGDGFHARVRCVKNKKRYTRKAKHKNHQE